jgi:hypothetical protein
VASGWLRGGYRLATRWLQGGFSVASGWPEAIHHSSFSLLPSLREAGRIPRPAVQGSRFKVQGSRFGAGCWMFDVGCWMFSAPLSAFCLPPPPFRSQDFSVSAFQRFSFPPPRVCGLWSRVPSAFASGGFAHPIASISNFYFLLSAFARSAFLPSAFCLLHSAFAPRHPLRGQK